MESVWGGLLSLDVVRATSAKFGLYAGNSNSVHNVNTFTYSYEYNLSVYFIIHHVQ
jgi:hypothetical protein